MKKKILFAASLLMMMALVQMAGAAEWTFLVYMDGDNNLEENAIDDINEMEQIGSDSNINIVVILDRILTYDTSNGNWTDTRRGRIIADSNTNTISSTLTTVGEKNMGDPATLTEFVNWGISNYPANRYALVIWDHGAGWRDAFDEIRKKSHYLQSPSSPEKNTIRSNPETRALDITNAKKDFALKEVCIDVTNSDELYTYEVRQALEGVSTNLDLVLFDACLMQMAEVAYEIRNEASVMVGSEQGVPIDGSPYHTILGDLQSDPTMTPSELGTVIVNRYDESYNGGFTLSAIDLSQMNSLAAALSTFANAMISADSEWPAMVRARFNTGFYADSQFRDLFGFMEQMAERASDAAVISAANQIIALFPSLVIANHSAPSEKANGLSIYLSNVEDTVDPTYTGSQIKLAADTTWDEFLQTASAKTVPDDGYESNDVFAQAASIDTGVYTSLCSKNDDWYKIYLERGARITVGMNHLTYEGNLDLQLYDSSQSVLNYSDWIFSDLEYFHQEITETGYYYLRVYGVGGATNPYYEIYVHDLSTETGGYWCRRVPYEFEDYTGSINLNLDDDDFDTVSLGFDFEFFNKPYSYIRISSNGYLTFGTMPDDYANIPFPLPVEPLAVIAPFWDDLVPGTGEKGVFYKITGSPGFRKLIVTWVDCPGWFLVVPTESGATFQAVLSEEEDMIRFNYMDVDFGDETYDNGKSATVGLESEDGTAAYLYSFNEANLSGNMSLLFYPPGYTAANSSWNLYE